MAYKLIWEDQFNQKIIDESIWNIDQVGGTSGNNEAQYYHRNNAYIKDNILHLVAKKEQVEGFEYTSAKLTTKHKKEILHGKIEVLAQVPKGKGTWPAIWLLGSSISQVGWPLCGEIDVMEHVGHTPNEIHMSLHTKANNHLKNNHQTKYLHIKDATDRFVKYVVIWQEDSIEFYIDDVKIVRFDKPKDPTQDNWPYNQPFYLILNLAIGGWWGGKIDDDIFPVTFKIKHVKVYESRE